jgi:putative DNA primase/helicase
VEVGIDATTMAIQWFDYLESHAQRLYSLADDRGINSAKLIVDRRQKLPTKFTSRDVQRRHWSGLKDHQDVIDALETLVEHRYLIEAHQSSGPSGGRPKTLYSWHSSLTKQS